LHIGSGAISTDEIPRSARDDKARVILEAAYYGVILRPKAEESHPLYICSRANVTDEIPRCARDDAVERFGMTLLKGSG
jgi:hypothetical protein